MLISADLPKTVATQLMTRPTRARATQILAGCCVRLTSASLHSFFPSLGSQLSLVSAQSRGHGEI